MSIPSGLLKLNLSDVAKGLAVAVIAALLSILGQMMTAHGFDFASYDWLGIIDFAWKAAGVYLTKNLLTDSEGKVLGVRL
jgi:hypothetical protein